jgi:chromosome segregation ATPase
MQVLEQLESLRQTSVDKYRESVREAAACDEGSEPESDPQALLMLLNSVGLSPKDWAADVERLRFAQRAAARIQSLEQSVAEATQRCEHDSALKAERLAKMEARRIALQREYDDELKKLAEEESAANSNRASLREAESSLGEFKRQMKEVLNPRINRELAAARAAYAEAQSSFNRCTTEGQRDFYRQKLEAAGTRQYDLEQELQEVGHFSYSV